MANIPINNRLEALCSEAVMRYGASCLWFARNDPKVPPSPPTIVHALLANGDHEALLLAEQIRRLSAGRQLQIDVAVEAYVLFRRLDGQTAMQGRGRPHHEASRVCSLRHRLRNRLAAFLQISDDASDKILNAAQRGGSIRGQPGQAGKFGAGGDEFAVLLGP